jgi:DNA/RNA-binding domain of Phe-tRNA-synthetase-like protein
LLRIACHESLDVRAFVTRFPRPLAQVASEPAVLLASVGLFPPVDDAVRKAVRDALRHDGYKPTGRGKPSSEYLARTAGEAGLPAINLAVDACNVISLVSGLPISVVDRSKLREPLQVQAAAAGSSYVFNASGQTIDIGGLPCLHDADGPCANPVKDAQRTKTSGETTETLSLLWGARELGTRVSDTVARYRELLEKAGAVVTIVDGA